MRALGVRVSELKYIGQQSVNSINVRIVMEESERASEREMAKL